MIPTRTTRAVPAQSRGWRAVAVASIFALLASACSSVQPTPSPGGTTAPSGSQPSETQAPGATGQPGPVGSPGIGEVAAPPALPLPTIKEAFGVGEALYDPTRMDVAVVSLLSLMGVGIYARDGTPIRKGAEHAAGDPWLYDTEVRGLIDMGIEDMLSGAEGGGPFKLSDLYESISGQLTRPVSLDDFVAAYRNAYAQHADDLVPQVLLGQPIEASMQLTRVQLWLLLMDGFVGPAAATTGELRPGVHVAQAATGPRFGTVQQTLPPLSAPAGFDPADWEELLAHLPTLAETVPFATFQSRVHEGHGGPGAAMRALASVGQPSPIVSPVSGHTLLSANTGSRAGLEVRWASRNEGVLRAHGSLSTSLPAAMTTDASGGVDITYTPKKEVANGQGVVANDFGSLYATANRFQLVDNAYQLPNVTAYILARSWIGGGVTAQGRGFNIEWHTKGIEVGIVNEFNVKVGLSPGFNAVAERNGVDSWSGVLTKRDDGTWRGVMEGLILGEVNRQGHPDGKRTDTGTLVLPLAGATCTAVYTGGQSLLVIGQLRAQAGLIDPDVDVLQAGTFGGEDLFLHVYPASPPYGDRATCSGEPYEPYLGPPYVGPGPDGTGLVGTYAAWNDTRFTSPDPGYRIHLPPSGGSLVYEDRSQLVSLDVASQFTVTVARSPGS